MIIDKINQRLRELTAENIDIQVELAYDEFIQSKLYLQELETFAVHSYDNDAIFYGEMI